MFRMTSLVAGLVLAIAPLATAQEPQRNQQTPEDAMATRELIAWSNLLNVRGLRHA